jgi:PRC-barrel domain
MTMWEYRSELGALDRDLVGFDVEAVDGKIGSIDEASNETGSAYLVVDTGFWIFGKKRLIPAGVVDRIDDVDRKIFVRMTKDQIKSAPDFEEQHRNDRELYDKYYDTYWS